jgi:hypothetical protein
LIDFEAIEACSREVEGKRIPEIGMVRQALSIIPNSMTQVASRSGKTDIECRVITETDDVRRRLVSPIRILNSHFQAAGDLITKQGKTRPVVCVR